MALTQSGQTNSYLYRDESAVAVQGSAPAALLLGPLRDELLASYHDGEAYFASLDDHDSVIVLTDMEGNVHYSASYDTWGSIRTSSGEGGIEFGHIGSLPDGPGWWFNGVRYYSPTIGRFLQEDPGGMDASTARQWLSALDAFRPTPDLGQRKWQRDGVATNLPSINRTARSYQYGLSDPVTFRDPGGRAWVWTLFVSAFTVYEIIEVWECFSTYSICNDVCQTQNCQACMPPPGGLTLLQNNCKFNCQMFCHEQTGCGWKIIRIPITHFISEWGWKWIWP